MKLDLEKLKDSAHIIERIGRAPFSQDTADPGIINDRNGSKMATFHPLGERICTAGAFVDAVNSLPALIAEVERYQWRPIETVEYETAENGANDPILGLCQGRAVELWHDNADHFRDQFGTAWYPEFWMPLPPAPVSEEDA